ncbi:MAG: tetratricopeptide repeat protein [candidate division KSB1 bacterium]|nr:tetratricopeptide repeat protein [candidate division KSB1 bacterium]
MQQSYYIIAAASAVALCIVSIIVLRKRLKPSFSPNVLYIQGLNELVLGDPDKALKLLRKLVCSHTDYLDAYIHISNISRQKGDHENAIRILRDLLARPQLEQSQEILIIRSLAFNYWECQQYTWTLYACDRLLEIDKKDEWAKTKKIECFEALHDWENAFLHLKKINNIPKDKKQDILSLYKVEQGLVLISGKSEHHARLTFRQAIKIKTDCFPAYLELVKSYIRERRAKDAEKELRKLIHKIPHMASVALEELSPGLYELGEFEQVEALYLYLLKSKQDFVDVYLGLAKIKEKKGELEKAVELNRKAYQKLSNDSILLQIIRLESKLGRHESVKSEINNVSAYQYEHSFACSRCGYTADSYFWHCPTCHNWNTARRGNS